MPEYVAPGIHVEETSFRAKSIEGVSTSTTAFAGVTRQGPFYTGPSDDGGGDRREELPELLTSFTDFERIYGGIADLATGTNYLAHAVRAFFDNGGRRLFVSRVVPQALREDAKLGRAPKEGHADGADRLGDVNADDYGEALRAFERNEDVSIVAAPDAAAQANESVRRAVNDRLITHVSRHRAYRIAVLDTPRDQTPTQALEVRSRVNSHRAALYYPWVVVANPLAPGDKATPAELTLPPSGFICGIYARTDVQRGVWKAPANEVVLGALRFESNINLAQQELLNAAGVNCLRFFRGRGYRVWGARTASLDPEWKYVNVRRYFDYLERSIDRGTQWVVFEPNGERLWAHVTQLVSSFLYNEWVSGALVGTSSKEAFFVRCDRSTMTQDDLDNGRLICLIGVAAIKPAEFVIFRIGQKTADSRS
jgi:phage tail sheath protein FI